MLMAQGAQSLLLDEPTTYLDVRHQLELMALLRSLTEEGRCVAAVLHDLRQAASCDRVLVLEQGSILYDGPGSGLYVSRSPLGGFRSEIRMIGEKKYASADDR